MKVTGAYLEIFGKTTLGNSVGAWCTNRHVVEIAFGINSGELLNVIGRFAGRMGYSKTGENFMKHCDYVKNMKPKA